jgi:hypothetical protein
MFDPWHLAARGGSRTRAAPAEAMPRLARIPLDARWPASALSFARTMLQRVMPRRRAEPRALRCRARRAHVTILWTGAVGLGMRVM